MFPPAAAQCFNPVQQLSGSTDEPLSDRGRHTQIRDRRARNRVTRADAAADCFCFGIGSNGRQTHRDRRREAGGGLRGAGGETQRRGKKAADSTKANLKQ